MWGATCWTLVETTSGRISIHAPHVGSDFNDHLEPEPVPLFQSTLPMWGATYAYSLILTSVQFQSTLPMWGATLRLAVVTQMYYISIHAPHVGSDIANIITANNSTNFNPRSPCGERHRPKRLKPMKRKFQSTLPMWGATGSDIYVVRKLVKFQSTLPMWGATAPISGLSVGINISIHAPHVGSDLGGGQTTGKIIMISIHAPHVGSDKQTQRKNHHDAISIHAPHVGSDKSFQIKPRARNDFNPRSPCGERHLGLS